MFNNYTALVFDDKESKCLDLKMLQRLPIVLAQVKLGNTSEDFLTEFWEIVYSLYLGKKSPKKVWSYMINSIWILSYKKNTVFMNFENSKSSDPNKLLFNLPDEMNLKGSDKYVTLSNLNICYT